MFRILARLSPDDPLNVARRSAGLFVVAFLPVLGLALAEGLATSQWDPLLFKAPVYARWFLSVPLFFAAERFVEARVTATMRYLRAVHVVSPGLDPEVRDLERRATRGCDSAVAEGVLFTLALAVSFADTPLGAPPSALWHGLVALTIYRLVLLRWFQRWLTWTLLMIELARLDLTPSGMHPDQAGGLGVLVQPSRGFALVILALGAVVASELGMRMYAGVPFDAVAAPAAAFVGISVSLSLIPLLPFVATLAEARRHALYDFGEFARGYVDAFQAKWVPRGGQEALGSSDIQSLNDLAGAYGVTLGMRAFPFTPRFVIEMVAVALLPILPLYLASLSLDQLASALIGIVF